MHYYSTAVGTAVLLIVYLAQFNTKQTTRYQVDTSDIDSSVACIDEAIIIVYCRWKGETLPLEWGGSYAGTMGVLGQCRQRVTCWYYLQQ